MPEPKKPNAASQLATAPEEYEMDDNGVVMPAVEREKPSWLTQFNDRAQVEADDMVHRNHLEMTPEHKEQAAAAIAAAKKYADDKARPALRFLVASQTGAPEIAKALHPAGRALYDVAPKRRDPVMLEREFSNDAERDAYLERLASQYRPPIQMQREFSNDQEKEAYLERVREAMKRAGQTK